MFHLFLYPLHESMGALNVFRYVTFRSIGSAVTAFLVLFAFGPFFIRWLKSRQIGQIVRDDGPSSHFSKRGVPTMGGMLIVLSILLSTLLWADLRNGVVWLCIGLTLFFGMIGSVDDWKKVTKSSSKGLSPRGKLVLQVSGALTVGLFLYFHPDYDSSLSLPFLKEVRPELGWWQIVLAVAVIVGASNAVNLTDGLDGLAAGPVMITAAVYSIFAYAAGNIFVADYLQIPHVLGAGEVAVFCCAIVGSCLGFLWFNAYPAQVFMGDVGSLALGGALGAVAVIIKQEILLTIVGGIFVMEALSVIMQVCYYKASGGRRIFLMAPFHHHFEKKGWSEPKVVVRFWIVSIILGLMALATLKLR